MMNGECPSCKQITNTSCSRLVKDSCGHTKCRICLLYEEQGCKICSNEHYIQNIGNYDCIQSTKGTANNISAFDRNSEYNDEIVLPLELVINKHSKSKTTNSELVPNDCINNSELYDENSSNKRKEAYNFNDVKNDDSSNKLYISKVENNDLPLHEYAHSNDNSAIEPSSYSKTQEICDLEIKTEFSSNEKLIKDKSIKSSNRTHISIIPGTPEKYKCNICSKIFRNKKGKCYHDACLTGVKPYKCSFCDRTFIKRSHFEYHERVHRGYKPFKCNLCEKAFPQRNKLNRHMYSHNKEKQFVCTKCNKRYSKRDDLKNHLDAHNGIKKYSCKACEKTFGILTNLKRHLKTHTNERPHVCDQCSKSFKDKSLLIRHKKTHGKDRPFSCAHCNRVFLSKSELRRHLTVHSEEKPFSCEYCQTVFRRKDNLHRHIRHHHPDNPFCNINNVQDTVSNRSTSLEKTKQVNLKQKQKPKKAHKMTSNLLPKSSTKVSMVYVSSSDQINSRLDSMGNITPVIRTTSEVSNAVPVINGPISIKKPEDKTDTRKKTFTYTEPIPLAEAVVINRRIEEKLYPQNVSNHNYFFRNCLNCTDKSYSDHRNETSRTNPNIKNVGYKTILDENSFSESDSSLQTTVQCHNEEKTNS
ncbi:zinc finger protein 782-like [Hylaeus anthracinus]|uniref:zinc finger protein 782-like n=1 Tax=Hylaeus anthracinus TaxID=313031 RepID=UPI0023B9661A|nr:zinc finger protein 782-like [Hylaeus anthracinus]